MVTEVPHNPRPEYSYFLSPGLQYTYVNLPMAFDEFAFLWLFYKLTSLHAGITWFFMYVRSFLFAI